MKELCQLVCKRTCTAAIALFCIGMMFPIRTPAQQQKLDSLHQAFKHAPTIEARLNAAVPLLKNMLNAQMYDSMDYYCHVLLPDAERLHHTKLLLTIHFNKAVRFTDKGRADSALKELRLGEQLAISTRDTANICKILDFMGRSMMQQDDLEGVRKNYHQSLGYWNNPPARVFILRLSMMYGSGLAEKKQYDSSVAVLSSALALARTLPEPAAFHEAQYWLAGTYIDMGRYADAEKLIQEAAAYYQLKKMGKALAGIRHLTGEIQLKRKQYREAITSFQTVLDFGKENDDTEALRETYPLLAEAYTGLGDWKNAFTYLKFYNTLADSLHSAANKTAVADLKLQFDNELKVKENQVLSLQLENRKAVIARQRWMIGSVIGLLLLSGLGYWLYLRYRRRRWQQEMEQKKAESELLNLKSQFDPHFIHNFFAFLVKQVKEGAREKSVSLLNDCSRYFRNILEQNRANIISLEEEIEGLTRYLNLQQQIHEGKFEYSIEADEKLDTFGIELPAFLFQPFVENALKHGFGNIDYKGKLEIKFSADDHYLEGIVADNGPGTSKANAPEHKSVGTQLTHERLDLFTKLKKLGKGWIESGARKEGPGYLVRVKLPLA